MEYQTYLYETNDMSSLKKCKQQLIFGHLESENNYEYDWKYVELNCPTCGFIHEFKRI